MANPIPQAKPLVGGLKSQGHLDLDTPDGYGVRGRHLQKGGDGWHDGDAYGSVTAAQAAAAEAGVPGDGVRLSPKIYNAPGNLTIGAPGIPVDVAPGAVLRPPPGSTYEIAGPVRAELRQWIDPSAGGSVVFTGPLPAVYPEWFGAVGDSQSDDTAAVQAAIRAAGPGGVVYLSALYAVSGVTITREESGITLTGRRGTETKGRYARSVGLCALGPQEYVLKFGEVDVPEVSGIMLQDMVLDGMGHSISKALLWSYKASQGKAVRVSIRAARGPGVFANKIEDWNWDDCQFVLLGSAEHPGGVVYGPMPPESTFGSNVNFFSRCRFEWIDGGFVRTSSEPNSVAAGIFFSQCKFEVGTDQDWGSEQPNYGVIHLENSNWSFVTNWRISDCWFQNVHHPDCIVRLGESYNFVFENNTLSAASGQICLFRLKGPGDTPVKSPNFTFRNNVIRNYNLNWGGWEFSFENLNTCPVEVEYPRDVGTPASLTGSPDLHGMVEASRFGARERLVPDPDPDTDPCVSMGRTVAAGVGQSSEVLLTLGSHVGVANTVGVGIRSPAFIRLLVRCKKAGSATPAQIRVATSSQIPAIVTVDSEKWVWKEVFVNSRNLTSTVLHFTNSPDNDPEHVVYLDAVILEYTNSFRASAIPVSGRFEVGDILYYTTPTAGGKLGAVCVAAGTPGTWKEFGEIDA